MNSSAIRLGTVSIALLAGVGLAVAGGAAGQQTGTKTSPGMETTGQASPGVGTTGQATPGMGAAGQDRLNLSADQRQKLQQGLQREAAQQQSAPAGFQAMAGQSVPQDVNLQPLPQDLATEVPAAQGHQFARMDDDSFIIADQNRQIVDVIHGDGTVGAAPGAPATGAPGTTGAPATGAAPQTGAPGTTGTTPQTGR